MNYRYDIRTCEIDNCIKTIEDIGKQKYVDWQPGNGTRYALLFTRINARVMMDASNDWQITWLSKRKTMFISDNSFVYHGYVAEKMGVCEADAICIAEAIGHILGLKSARAEDFNPDLVVSLTMES